MTCKRHLAKLSGRPPWPPRFPFPARMASLVSVRGYRRNCSRFICAGILALFLTPAHAQQAKYDFRCKPYTEVMRAIQAYNEKLIGVGLTDRGNMIQQFQGRGGSFTIVVIYPTEDMRTCIAENGTQWQALYPFAEAA